MEQDDHSWMSGIDAREQGPLRAAGPAVGLGTEGVARSGPSIQPKLTVNEPGDEYEEEAERIADAVMRMPGPEEGVGVQKQLPSDRAQRMCTRCRRRARQGKPLECEECEEELQRQSDGSGGEGAAPVRQAKEATRGPGRPLPDRTRSFFESRMSADFGDVRIHTGGEADRAARSINARAYTLGSDVVFRSGEHQPYSREGKRLLAHELTHVVQQRSGSETGPLRQAVSESDARIQRQSAEECAYGEIRSWAVQGADNDAPNGLADAVASIGEVCSDANCSCYSPDPGTTGADRDAWNNIQNATGGTDRSNGGNFMCVGTENCWFVDQCYDCVDGEKQLVARDQDLETSGTVQVNGGGTLYFYDDDLQGWCDRDDYNRGGCAA